jgi:hypothetical protein
VARQSNGILDDVQFLKSPTPAAPAAGVSLRQRWQEAIQDGYTRKDRLS